MNNRLNEELVAPSPAGGQVPRVGTDPAQSFLASVDAVSVIKPF